MHRSQEIRNRRQPRRHVSQKTAAQRELAFYRKAGR